MTTILDKFSSSKNAITEVNQETKDFIKYIESLDSIGDRNVKAIATSFGDVSESVIDAAQDLKTGKIGLDEFKNTTASATTETSAFGATLKTVAANIAIMVAITLAFKGIAWIIDQVVVTTAELEEAANNAANELSNIKSKEESLNAELATTKDRIEELENHKTPYKAYQFMMGFTECFTLII